MSLIGWREVTVRILAEKLGPVAELIVDDAVRKAGVSEREMVAANYLKVIEHLHHELPAEVDRDALCRLVRDRVLAQCGPGSGTAR